MLEVLGQLLDGLFQGFLRIDPGLLQPHVLKLLRHAERVEKAVELLAHPIQGLQGGPLRGRQQCPRLRRHEVGQLVLRRAADNRADHFCIPEKVSLRRWHGQLR
ncbi:hypothetical protein P5706_08840 [Pseudomonas sp. ChxA]|uniref:hypothetical protein n=1 Tax=Pseudomonas sp. ChxA TaxID=3035473 RepID=UPI002555C7B6|nr:hypothetical protein [Pseudomonas sp. ChxA]MDL2184292.1 hypothetical protein [Pseudomonas sp. ChxA]